MNIFWYFLYNITVLPLLMLYFTIARLFSEKVRIGIEGRKLLFENVEKNLTKIDHTKKLVWFHSASLGEFEQAKPIIEKLKKEYRVNILITFFSPSGYKNSIKYPYADIISYIPFDTRSLSEKFVNLVKPDLVLFMRYDFWPNLVRILKVKKVPSFIVDATMRSDSKRLWLISKSFHKVLFKDITKILTVSEEDAKNFNLFDYPEEKLKAVGDTRFDRVYIKSLDAKSRRLFTDGFFAGKKVFVFGSSWEADEEVILPAIEKLFKHDKNIVMIIAPHEPTILHLEKLEQTFNGKIPAIRFSYLNHYNNERIIIVDSIGILLTLYHYANLVYVGGSFKQGIHNVLEPAVYGVPVIFGPKIQNSREALMMVELGCGIVVENKKEAYRHLRNLFTNDSLRESLGKISSGFVNKNIGATDKITDEISKVIHQ
ncbi:MAG: 3-deoxy-D-manno-octulosonic acid transferase [Flavobacterium sp.]|nr:3-deoxy-D-manno-octulosonic acid transferase [Flavobacterium sp.]